MNWVQKNIDVFLPQYLSDSSKNSLRESLKQFPENIDERLYSKHIIDESSILQGDGIEGMDVYDVSSQRTYQSPCLVISNTCDIDLRNKRFSPINVCCVPIYNFAKIADNLRSKHNKSHPVEDYLKAMQRQEISHCFYLPSGGGLKYDGIAFFDKMISFTNSEKIHEKFKLNRFFSLSLYGFYLFLFKLSYHFTRIAEGIDRDAPDNN